MNAPTTPAIGGNLPKERTDLAAAYRLVAHFGMDDSIYTHISAKAPGGELFLLNSYGQRFTEVKASELVTVDLDGTVIDDPLGHGINAAGFTIHSAVHAARPDVGCVLHTHTVAGVAVSCLEEGLLPLNQWSLQFHGRVAYHAFEGMALNLEERARLQADLGTAKAMILRNHGLMTCGRSVGEAFVLMHNLERACQAQLAAQATSRPLRLPSPEIAELTARQYETWDALHASSGLDDPEWDAFLRLTRDVAPDFES
ncbi:MAG: class II aldolase/adducin family protein [Phyllobacteriaceae bacterium]|nr:class II aldolase/adducin family protein [Phyllobacteriaceae bacterium]